MAESKAKKFLHFLSKYKNIFIYIFVPAIAAIIPIVIETQAAKCAFVVILMAGFWLTSVLPLCLTALLPILLYPTLGILKSDEVCPLYFKDIVMLLFGGLVIANAIEMTKLHERIALIVLVKFGSDPKWLMLGFMIVTAFMSLWISNTASTAMMLPVVDAVVIQLEKLEANANKVIFNHTVEHTIEMKQIPSSDTTDNATEIKNSLEDISSLEEEISNDEKQSEESRKLATGFLLSCSYSTTIGGMGSLVGTASNVVLKGYFDRFHPEAHLDFLTFLLFGLPIAIFLLFIAWLWLVLRWLPRKNLFKCCRNKKVGTNAENSPDDLSSIIKEKYSKLGPMSWAEKCVGCVFLLLVVLWITRDLHVVPGWDSIFLSRYVTDSTPAILAVFLLFILPSENIFTGKPYNHLLDWKTLQKAFSWDLMLLLGGSLAMADGFQVSGLSDWIGSQLKSFASLDKEVALILILIVGVLATQFVSNTTIASVFLPIVDSIVSEDSKMSAVYLMIPMVIAVSLSFMLPVSAPNNTIIFASGRLRMIDMVTTGFVMNLIGMITVYIAANTYLGYIFDLTLTTNKNCTTLINFNTTTALYTQ